MQCANPDCRAPAIELTTGVLRLVELDVPPEERVIRSDGGFPVCSVPSRYFWLCPKCSCYLRVCRWTVEGVTFETRTGGKFIPSNERFIPLHQHRSHASLEAIRKTA
jgi:hypothetical protein